MAKKCVYCDSEIIDERAIEVCDKCGVGTWGQKMFANIIKQTNDARDNGDLCHTSPAVEPHRELDGVERFR